HKTPCDGLKDRIWKQFKEEEERRKLVQVFRGVLVSLH
ncbi:hypothetical protein AWRI1631_81090, partial [Saccharomyces cerevisiae AWRI1631]